MAKKGQISHYAAQKAAKPDVRELIELTCDGEVRTRALELLAFFQSLRMKPAWASTNSYALSYKGKRVGYFKLGRGDKFARNCLDVQIYPIENYDAFLRGRTEDERALFCAEFGNSFVRPCRACGGCAPGLDVTVCGKTYTGVCQCSRYITNPTERQCAVPPADDRAAPCVHPGNRRRNATKPAAGKIKHTEMNDMHELLNAFCFFDPRRAVRRGRRRGQVRFHRRLGRTARGTTRTPSTR